MQKQKVKRNSNNYYKYIVGVYCFLITVFLFTSIFYTKPTTAQTSTYPKLANFYLNNPILNSDVSTLAQWDVLVLHMLAQNYSAEQIKDIRKLNPNITILAYVPSEEFPITKYQGWDPQNGLFHKMLAGITDDMWLVDENDSHVKFWVDNWMLNMSDYSTTKTTWNEYLSSFVVDEILSTGLWDGIFFDNVWTGIGWINSGNIDIDNDGKNDSQSTIDSMWKAGNEKLFSSTRSKYGKDVILVGNGDRGYYGYLNGLYIEDYLIANSSWESQMDFYNQATNSALSPNYSMVGNSPVATTNGKADYQAMRYGLTSALMDDGYYGFDAGGTSHAEIWWYDEYNVNLGTASANTVSKNNQPTFKSDLWRRNFQNGIALVNSTDSYQTATLGADYEKIQGTQDTKTNDGSIINTITIAPKDGVLLLNSLQGGEDSQIVTNMVFENGAFLRFYDNSGNRVRNGFFVFDDKFAGGDKIFRGDLNGQTEKNESILIEDNFRIKINDDQDRRLYYNYPLGSNDNYSINLAVGSLFGDADKEIMFNSTGGGKIMIVNYYGVIMQYGFHPFGEKDRTSFSIAIGNVDGGKRGESILGFINGTKAEVLVYDFRYDQLKKRFTVGNNANDIFVTAGDTNGDGVDEIITALVYSDKTTIKTFDSSGNKKTEFSIQSGFSGKTVGVGVIDANYDGKKDIVLMSK